MAEDVEGHRQVVKVQRRRRIDQDRREGRNTFVSCRMELCRHNQGRQHETSSSSILGLFSGPRRPGQVSEDSVPKAVRSRRPRFGGTNSKREIWCPENA